MDPSGGGGGSPCIVSLTAQAAAAASWDDVVRLLVEFQQLQPAGSLQSAGSADDELAMALQQAAAGVPGAAEPAMPGGPKASPRRAAIAARSGGAAAGKEDALSRASPCPYDQQQQQLQPPQQQQQQHPSVLQAGGASNLAAGPPRCRSSSDDGAPPEDAQRSSTAAAAAIAAAAAAEALSAALGDVGAPPGLAAALAMRPPHKQPPEQQACEPPAQRVAQAQAGSRSSGGAPGALAALGLAHAGSLGLQGRLSWDDLDVSLLLAAAAARVSSGGGAPPSSAGSAAGSAPGMPGPMLPSALVFDGNRGTAAYATGPAGSGPPGLTPASSSVFAGQAGGSLGGVLGGAAPAASARFGSLALSSDGSNSLLAGMLSQGGTPTAGAAAAAAAAAGAAHFFSGTTGSHGPAPPGLPLQLGAAGVPAFATVSRFAPGTDVLMRFPPGSIRTGQALTGCASGGGMSGLAAAVSSHGGTPRVAALSGGDGAGPDASAGDVSPRTAGSVGGGESGGSTPVKKTRRGCRGGRQKRWYMAQQMAAAAAMSGAGVSSYDVYRALSSGVPVGSVLPSLAASGLITAAPPSMPPAAAQTGAASTTVLAGLSQHLLLAAGHTAPAGHAAPAPLSASQLSLSYGGLDPSLLAHLPQQLVPRQL